MNEGEPKDSSEMDRRNFLKTVAAAGGTFIVGESAMAETQPDNLPEVPSASDEQIEFENNLELLRNKIEQEFDFVTMYTRLAELQDQFDEDSVNERGKLCKELSTLSAEATKISEGMKTERPLWIKPVDELKDKFCGTDV